EQGSRIAGAAVGPLFLPYYSLQLACGVVAVLTALVFVRSGGINRVRLAVLLLAGAGAGLGWGLGREDRAMGEERSGTSDVGLLGPSPSEAQKQAADEARAAFGTWHGYSLSANLGTLALVTAAMAMAAFLPQVPRTKPGA